MSFIGDEIKRTRKRAGITSRQLAESVTLTPQYIRLIECGGAIPAMDTVLRICNQFPDADSAQWGWLLITDLYGAEMQRMLWAYARREWGAAVDEAANQRAAREAEALREQVRIATECLESIVARQSDGYYGQSSAEADDALTQMAAAQPAGPARSDSDYAELVWKNHYRECPECGATDGRPLCTEGRRLHTATVVMLYLTHPSVVSEQRLEGRD